MRSTGPVGVVAARTAGRALVAVYFRRSPPEITCTVYIDDVTYVPEPSDALGGRSAGRRCAHILCPARALMRVPRSGVTF